VTYTVVIVAMELTYTVSLLAVKIR